MNKLAGYEEAPTRKEIDTLKKNIVILDECIYKIMEELEALKKTIEEHRETTSYGLAAIDILFMNDGFKSFDFLGEAIKHQAKLASKK